METIKSLDPQMVRYSLYALSVVIAIILLILPSIIVKKAKTMDKKIHSNKENIINNWKTKHGFLSYERIEKFLIENGVEYSFKMIKEPTEYIEMIILSSLVSAGVASIFNVYVIPIAMIVGLFIPYALIKISNNKDNEDMMMDISLIFNALYTQIESGIFVDSAIKECYSIIKHPRLRKEMFKLTGALERNDTPFEEQMDQFNSCFVNPQIESLVIILKQAKKSGKAVNALNDSLDQVKEVEKAVLFLKKEKNALRSQMLQLCSFGVTLIMVIIYSFIFIQKMLVVM